MPKSNLSLRATTIQIHYRKTITNPDFSRRFQHLSLHHKNFTEIKLLKSNYSTLNVAVEYQRSQKINKHNNKDVIIKGKPEAKLHVL